MSEDNLESNSVITQTINELVSSGCPIQFDQDPESYGPAEVYHPKPEEMQVVSVNRQGKITANGGKIARYLEACGYRYHNLNFYIFNGRYYQIVDKDDLSREITASILFLPDPPLLTRSFKQDVIDQLKDIANLVNRDDVPDSFIEDERYNGWLIPFENGIYNVGLRRMVPFTPYIFFDHIIHAKFAPLENHPVEEIYRAIFPNDATRDFFYLAVGFTLYSDILNPEALFVLLGPGGTGKSAILHTLATLLGHDMVTSLDPVQLSTQFATIELNGKLANLCTEAAKTKKGHVDGNIIKKLVSGEPYSIDRKYSSRIMFTNQAKMWFAANDMPDFGDTSSGMMRRVHVFPCLQKQDPSKMIYDIMCAPEALSWLAFKALRSFILFRMNKDLTFEDPAEMTGFSGEFRDQDSFMDFMASEFENLNDLQDIADRLDGVPTSELYDKYRTFAFNNGDQFPIKQRSFTTRTRLEFRMGLRKVSVRNSSGGVSSYNIFVKDNSRK